MAVRTTDEDLEKNVVDLTVFHPNSGGFLVFGVPEGQYGKDGCWFWPVKIDEEKIQKDKKLKAVADRKVQQHLMKQDALEEAARFEGDKINVR